MASLFPLPSVRAMMAHAAKAQARVAELRAITGMTEAEALEWMIVLSGIQATSAHETPDTTWTAFSRAIAAGEKPVSAAAEIVRRMRQR